MKKRVLAGIILLIISMVLITTSHADFAMNMNFIGSASTVKTGEEFEVTIKLSDKVIASNFKVNYNSSNFEFESSETAGLNTAVINEKVACIYADINGIGTDSFKLKFKALTETSSVNFTIEDVKIRAIGQSVSYTAADIKGISEPLTVVISNSTIAGNTSTGNTVTSNTIAGNTSTGNTVTSNTVAENKTTGNILEVNTSTNNTLTKNSITGNTTTTGTITENTTKTNTVSTTTATSALPKTGKNEILGYVLMGCSILLIISGVTKYKEKELKKIFKAGGLMIALGVVVASTINKPVSATVDTSITNILFYDSLISNKNNVTIQLAKGKDSITKSEIISLNPNITDVTNTNTVSLTDNDLVKTGDIVKVDLNTYTVILYGDANYDGTACNENDLICIENDYLEKAKLVNEAKLATNLENSDNILDTDDLSKIIDKHLAKDVQLVTNVPTGNVEAIKVQSIDLSMEGSTLKATILPNNATCKDIIWDSSNKSVVTISNGAISLVGEGTAVVTAKAAGNNNISSSYTATVTKHTHTGNSNDGGGCYSQVTGTREVTTYCSGCKQQINYCNRWTLLDTDRISFTDGTYSTNLVCPVHGNEVHMSFSDDPSHPNYFYNFYTAGDDYIVRDCPCYTDYTCPGHTSTANVYGLGCGKTEGQLLLDLQKN